MLSFVQLLYFCWMQNQINSNSNTKIYTQLHLHTINIEFFFQRKWWWCQYYLYFQHFIKSLHASFSSFENSIKTFHWCLMRQNYLFSFVFPLTVCVIWYLKYVIGPITSYFQFWAIAPLPAPFPPCMPMLYYIPSYLYSSSDLKIFSFNLKISLMKTMMTQTNPFKQTENKIKFT